MTTEMPRERVLIREAGSRIWAPKLVVAAGPSVKPYPYPGFSADQMAKWVGGMFAAGDLGNGLVALVDQNGMYKDLLHNCFLQVDGRPVGLQGTVVIVRRDGASYVGLLPEDDALVRRAEVTFP